MGTKCQFSALSNEIIMDVYDLISSLQQSSYNDSTACSQGCTRGPRNCLELFSIHPNDTNRKLTNKLLAINVQINATLLLSLQNPEYMKEGFHLTITSMHFANDLGQQENVRIA